MVALEPNLEKKFFELEESQTDMNIVSLLMTSIPMLIEKYMEKYFLNIFYQLDAWIPQLAFEDSFVDITKIKNVLFEIILRDKEKINHSSNLQYMNN